MPRLLSSVSSRTKHKTELAVLESQRAGEGSAPLQHCVSQPALPLEIRNTNDNANGAKQVRSCPRPTPPLTPPSAKPVPHAWQANKPLPELPLQKSPELQ